MNITLKMVNNFIEGNIRYYNNKYFNEAPEYIKEQIRYRLAQCSKDCLPENKCKECKCPPYRKAWNTESCNIERFPNLMDKDNWEEFKLSEEYDKRRI